MVNVGKYTIHGAYGFCFRWSTKILVGEFGVFFAFFLSKENNKLTSTRLVDCF